MLCQECQERTASLHFTNIINGKKTEVHLCDQCAKEKGESMYVPNYSIQDLLSGLLNFEPPKSSSSSTQTRRPRQLVCNKCGMNYETFAKKGRFGCSYCYQAFDKKLDPIFKRVHSGNHLHSGKVPKRIGGRLKLSRQIDDLREKMRQYIASEEFEEAAEIRDKIRELEKSIQDKGEGE
ncbi:UvrB/UvrC motif-containing protein [Thalassorhabdus alkalitolerans]|uniref:UvrB/UvrC motif-containing protein n=1 Tax=Thalassorhabdus alkalitolerans TaxID=2282697 RepID=A0ABW0YNM8_9BACI